MAKKRTVMDRVDPGFHPDGLNAEHPAIGLAKKAQLAESSAFPGWEDMFTSAISDLKFAIQHRPMTPQEQEIVLPILDSIGLNARLLFWKTIDAAKRWVRGELP